MGYGDRRDTIGLLHSSQVINVEDPKDVIEAAIRLTFDSFPKEDDPDCRSPPWITPKECWHLTALLELDAKGFQIVQKAT